MLLLAGMGPATCQMLYTHLDLSTATERSRKWDRAHVPSLCPSLPRCREHSRARRMQVIRGMSRRLHILKKEDENQVERR